MAKTLVIIGLILVGIGLMLQFSPSLLKWFGHLPGDIRIEEGNTRVYIPVTSMILVSLVLSIIAHLWR